MITLLSDFGLQDPSVAVVKGVLMQHTATGVVDITHEVKPFNLPQAAYLLSAAYKNFPPGTCHVLLFDLFSETVPGLFLSEFNGHYFLSPDNGMLPLALGELPHHTWVAAEPDATGTFVDWLHAAGKIIHQLSMDKGDPGFPVYKLKTGASLAPQVTQNEVRCQVLHIDNYENVVINITKQQFETFVSDRPFQLQFMQMEEINEINAHYSEVRHGYKLCRFNSSGYLEICINHGKAASLFGLRIGGRYNDIKIILV